MSVGGSLLDDDERPVAVIWAAQVDISISFTRYKLTPIILSVSVLTLQLAALGTCQFPVLLP